jgi:hypothetical protein
MLWNKNKSVEIEISPAQVIEAAARGRIRMEIKAEEEEVTEKIVRCLEVNAEEIKEDKFIFSVALAKNAI